MRVLNRRFWPIQIKVGRRDDNGSLTTNTTSWRTGYSIKNDEMFIWCQDNLEPKQWTAYHLTEQMVFAFKNPKDATCFSLRFAEEIA